MSGGRASVGVGAAAAVFKGLIVAKVTRVLSLVWERGLDEVFPPRCVTCRSFGAFVCSECARDAEPAVAPRCRVCWVPTDAGTCADCRHRKPAFSGVRSAFSYGGSVRDTVLALKFESMSALAPAMGEFMATVFEEWAPPVQAIVPVPLWRARRRERGFDQAEMLAREVSRHSGVPLVLKALVRKRPTGPQARALDEESRRRNVAGAFAAAKGVPAGGVLLVDDVITTGATLGECARVLLDAGAGPVFGLTFARED